MKPKERIKAILTHKLADRVGIFDFFDEITVINWKQQGLLPDVDPAEYFDFDLNFKINSAQKDKFTFFPINGPFQRMASDRGLSQSLIDFTREPRHTRDFFKSGVNSIISEYKKSKQEGNNFDGVWLWEDIAYDNGLYFSFERYKDTLFDFHKQISAYFQDEGLFTIFHCDGGVEGLIPFLIKSNFFGIHPLQELSNPNIIRMKKDLKEAITFIGGIGLGHLKLVVPDTNTANYMPVSNTIIERIEELKRDGDYIFCFDGPIPQDTEFKSYENILAKIETIGAY